MEITTIMCALLVGCALTSYNIGLKKGAMQALNILENNGIIQTSKDGNITPGVKNDK